MIDLFAIFHRGGSVLWSWRHDSKITMQPVAALVRNVLLEEKKAESGYKHDNYVLKWSFDNDLELVFVAVYLNITQMLYIEELLEAVKQSFVSLYRNDVRFFKPPSHFADFEKQYLKIVDSYETRKIEKEVRRPRTFAETKKAQNVSDIHGRTSKKKKKDGIEVTAGKSTPGKFDTRQWTLRNKKGELIIPDGEEGDENTETGDTNEQDDSADDGAEEQQSAEQKSPSPTASPSPPPALNTLSASDTSDVEGEGSASDGGESSDTPGFSLDKLMQFKAKRSASGVGPRKPGPGKKPDSKKPAPSPQKTRKWDDSVSKEEAESLDFSRSSSSVSSSGAGTGSKPVKIDFKEDDDDDDDEPEQTEEEAKASSKKGVWGFLSTIVSGSVLDKEALKPVMEQFRMSLMGKNVAADIAEKLCESVSASLEGQKIGTFTTVKSEVKKSLEAALTRILTPKKSIDVLQGVLQAQAQGRPYTIVFVGVNGVGKSTSLAKVCAYLLSKGFKVSIAACDTFRSGAVEQLRTHAQCLQVPLFERGYNKDAAAVAMEAVKEAKKLKSDVVLVDTAGRMQDNEPLMRALSKLINMNKPDLVLFVGEALVGNDAVDQLTKFNQCLADLSTEKEARLIDGIVLTKFDTIDDKVGAAISMTYTTGQPIMFVGCGQTYNDLKKMNAKTLIKALLK